MVSLLLNSLYLDEVDWMGRLDGGYEQSRWVLRNALPECGPNSLPTLWTSSAPGRIRIAWAWDSVSNVSFVDKRDIFLQIKLRKRPSFKEDKRRKHHHWQVTVFYKDGERFARTYTVQAKATGFAERQRKSPVVKMARVNQVS